MLATFCQTAKLSPIQFGSRNYLSLASFAILVLVFHPVWQSYISMFGNIYIHIQYIHTPLELTNLGGGCVSSYLLICVNRESIGCQTHDYNIKKSARTQSGAKVGMEKSIVPGCGFFDFRVVFLRGKVVLQVDVPC
jgi:hypothetical protein